MNEQIEDAISRVRNIPCTPWIELRDGDAEACEIVALALIERLEREQEEPKPLSLDELRKRDGKPVWIEWLVEAANESNGWAIAGEYKCPIPTYPNQWNYEIKWLAYDLPPQREEINREGN